MKNPIAILSLLHEEARCNSATRLFRDEPVLRWTLKRLAASQSLHSMAILCWDDQADAVRATAGDVRVVSKGARTSVRELDAITAARNWADGWRGGLLGTCDFDLGFHAPWHLELAQEMQSNAIVLIDPASGLVDPHIVDALINHAVANPDTEMCFAPGAPGLGGALIRETFLRRLAGAQVHPGRLLHYLPDQYSREPLANEMCAPVPTSVARTTRRFKLDSNRQIVWLDAVTLSLNGQLLSTGAEELVQRAHGSNVSDALPRDVTLELNIDRNTRPIWSPRTHQKIDRTPLTVALARKLFAEIGKSDDVRLTLAGIGDPLLHGDLLQIVDLAEQAGISRIHIETDLSGVASDMISRLAASPVDVLSVHLPGVAARTYEQVMGAPGYEKVLESIKEFVAARQGKAVPILVPTFIKCRQNLGEMEAWYDQWLRAVGSAVIRGPSDFCGSVPEFAVADMAPPRRRPCTRIESRLTVLCDGTIVSCEEDALGRQPLGNVEKDSVADIWRQAFGALRSEHRAGQWNRPTCAACREWHRP